ncbi:MAG: NTP transferase domain-containing protein [Thalassotalea sp.]|nr:NTP transferase domain-containing protein [Thalassotalea sp.]
MTIREKSSYNQSCLGVVLTGGLSSRMGTDKALLNRHADINTDTSANSSATHENMLSFSTQQLKNIGLDDVIISGKKHGLADEFENLGPMGGIYTIFKKYHPKAMLILPVDLPLIDNESLKQLKRVGELSQQACFYHDNYLPLYLPITAFVEQFFEQAFIPFKQAMSSINSSPVKGPSIKALLAQTPHKGLKPTSTQSLFNANTPEQWQQAQQKFQQQVQHPILHNRKNHV